LTRLSLISADGSPTIRTSTPFFQVAVFQTRAFIPPRLSDLNPPNLAIGIDGQHAVGIAELCRGNDSGDLDIPAGRPAPAMMG